MPLQTTSHQPLQALIQPTLPVLQYPHSVLQPPQTGLQPSQAVPQSQPVQVVAHPGDGSTPMLTFVRYAMPPNIFSIHNLSRGWAMMISLFFPFIFLKPPLIISGVFF